MPSKVQKSCDDGKNITACSGVSLTPASSHRMKLVALNSLDMSYQKAIYIYYQLIVV
jgi:hypothetical protein